jgi:rare lipoprotein A
MYAMTAAHKTLPFNTLINVRNLNNDQEIKVRINDRGPFVRGRIIDLSYTAAKKLKIVGPGTAPVKITALGYTAPSKTDQHSFKTYLPADYYTGNFTIQVGAFTDRNNAERFKQKLDKLYKNAHITSYDNGEDIFYRVRVGRCSSLEQAIKYEEFLIQKGFNDAFAVAE